MCSTWGDSACACVLESQIKAHERLKKKIWMGRYKVDIFLRCITNTPLPSQEGYFYMMQAGRFFLFFFLSPFDFFQCHNAPNSLLFGCLTKMNNLYKCNTSLYEIPFSVDYQIKLKTSLNVLPNWMWYQCQWVTILTQYQHPNQILVWMRLPIEHVAVQLCY